MRLTAEILKASDICTDKLIFQSMALAAAGRFGIIPSNRKFKISLNFNKNYVEIEQLECLAITRGGNLIDICFDTRYSNPYETRLTLPGTDENVYILTVMESKDSWKETTEGYIEPSYTFHLISDNSSLSDDAFPIARIVREVSGWQVDTLDFVPPCLYISSHPDYESLCTQFANILNAAEKNIFTCRQAACTNALTIFWPAVQLLKITMDKDKDTMTPMMLFGNVQKFVSAFSCACTLDPLLNLADYEKYAYYINAPYDYRNVLQKIKEGLELSMEITNKVLAFKEIIIEEPEPEPEPIPQPKSEPAKPSRRRWDGLEI